MALIKYIISYHFSQLMIHISIFSIVTVYLFSELNF